MDKMTHKEIKLLHDFLGLFNGYEILGILSRIYEDMNDVQLQEKNSEILKIWMKLGRAVESKEVIE